MHFKRLEGGVFLFGYRSEFKLKITPSSAINAYNLICILFVQSVYEMENWQIVGNNSQGLDVIEEGCQETITKARSAGQKLTNKLLYICLNKQDTTR